MARCDDIYLRLRESTRQASSVSLNGVIILKIFYAFVEQLALVHQIIEELLRRVVLAECVVAEEYVVPGKV